MMGPQRRPDGEMNAPTRRSTSQTSAHASSRSSEALPGFPHPHQVVGISTVASRLQYQWSPPWDGVDTTHRRTSFSRLSELVALWSIDARRPRGSTQCSSVRTGGVRRMRTRCIMPTTVLGGRIGDALLSRLTRRPSGGTGRSTTSRVAAVVNTCKNRYTPDSVQQASTTHRFSRHNVSSGVQPRRNPSMLSSGGSERARWKDAGSRS